MNLKTLSVAATLVAAFAAGLIAGSVEAAAVAPAAYAAGTVTAIDAAQNTVTIDDQTFVVTPSMLNDVATGSEFEVAFILVDGKRTAIALEPVPADEGELVE